MTELKAIPTTNNNAMLFDDSMFSQLERLANVMTSSESFVPKQVRNTGDCMAISMQALRWGMDPFVVAQQAQPINGVMTYSAQLVNAVISTSTAIRGHFHYKYGGEWERILGKKPRMENKADAWGKMKNMKVGGWKEEDEEGLFVQVGAVISGDEEITWSEPMYLGSIEIRNSPLWATDTKQQIAYLGVKRWSRLYTPAVIMGVYTPDEIQVRDITPDQTERSEELEKRGKASIKKVSREKQEENVIDSTATEVAEKPAVKKEKAVVKKEVEPEPEKPKAKPVKNLIEEIGKASTPAEMKALKIYVGENYTGDDRKFVGKAWNVRNNELKELATEAKKKGNADLQEAMQLISDSSTLEGLESSSAFLAELAKAGKINEVEIEEFEKAFQEKQKSFGGG